MTLRFYAFMLIVIIMSVAFYLLLCWMLNVIMLSVVMLRVIMLSVVMLRVIMLNVVMQNVVMLSVMVPLWDATKPELNPLNQAEQDIVTFSL